MTPPASTLFRRTNKPTAVLIVAALLLGGTAHGLFVRGFDQNPDDYNRFTSGFPGKPVPNASPDFIAKGHDWSAIGWSPHNPKQAATLITLQHFLTSRHNAHGIGANIIFQNPGGQLIAAKVASYHDLTWTNDQGKKLTSDLVLGVFEKPIPASAQLTPIALPGPSQRTSLTNKELLVYGHSARFGKALISGFKNVRHRPEGNESTPAAYFLSVHKPGYATAQPGDSGSPCFLINNNRPILIGCLYAIHGQGATQRSYLAPVHPHLAQIQKIIAIESK